MSAPPLRGIVVTVPLSFGLNAWIDEGDAAGEPWSGQYWDYSTYGHRPDLWIGDPVYITYKGRLRGYAPLAGMEFYGYPGKLGHITLIRGGGAVAVTIEERIPGFRGWRYVWWPAEAEHPFPEWRTP